MNWKPYWGNGDDAVIVHFHGPKPQNHLGEGDPGLPENLVALQKRVVETVVRALENRARRNFGCSNRF